VQLNRFSDPIIFPLFAFRIPRFANSDIPKSIVICGVLLSSSYLSFSSNGSDFRILLALREFELRVKLPGFSAREIL